MTEGWRRAFAGKHRCCPAQIARRRDESEAGPHHRGSLHPHARLVQAVLIANGLEAVYADRLSKMFGTKLPGNPEVAARALSIHFGRRLQDLANALRDHLPGPEGDENSDF